MNFIDKLNKAVDKNNSLLCVGLDSDVSKLPEQFKTPDSPQFEFNKSIIDATADLVCSYKPNTAFYEAQGAKGLEELKKTCDYIREKYPNIPIIIDAKRGDIGNTNDGYAEFVFTYLGADAVTLHPYLGKESLESFLSHTDKGIIILCRTSNPGSGEFQDLEIISGTPLYQYIATAVSGEWNDNGNCLLVVGATYPEELRIIRSLVGPYMTLLIPGIGAQGGDLEAVMSAGLGAGKRGLIINSSRAIIFAENSRRAASEFRDEINALRG